MSNKELSPTRCLTHDESPHPDILLEWWFLQGYYEGDETARRHFMVSLFRQRIERENSAEPRQVYYLISSVTDAENGRHEFNSQVHQDVMDVLGENPDLESGNLDPVLFKAYFNEIRSYGPPSPIRAVEEEVRLHSHPLSIQWGDFSLSQAHDSFNFSFREPDSRRFCRFRLLPLKDVLDLKELKVSNLGTTHYINYPRLDLTGTVDSKAVNGQVWMDHQWGDFQGWLVVKKENSRYMGWNWLGINFDDGSDLIILVHVDVEKSETIHQQAVYHEPGSSAQVIKTVNMKPTGYWESPRTNVVYPTSWNIVIPELELEIDFHPLVDDQEIPFFGIIRAIWEGAGRVAGIRKGNRVEGRARLELQGYGYIFDFKKHLESYAARVDRQIESFFPRTMNHEQVEKYLGKPYWKHDPDAYSSTISQPVWDLISRKGKRWRPLFGILALESLGVDAHPYEDLIAATLELVHTGALIIDDIEDDSLLRRGEECIHLRYGSDVSINAGSTLYFLPYLMIKNHPRLDNNQRLEMYAVISDLLTQAHFGQAQDIFWSKNLNTANLNKWLANSLEEKILQMYAYKTAAAVQGVARAACIVARAEPEIRRVYESLGRAFGVAFQIVDDVHNFTDSPSWTKTCGEDIISGKLTYVIFKALSRLGPEESQILQSILCSREKRQDPEQLKSAVQIIRESDILRMCRQDAESMLEREWKHFSQLVPVTEAKIRLRLLISGLLNFAYDT